MTGDILNSIKATLYDRISNPLLGSFIASNLFWNYQFIWVLFSSMTVDEKFKYVDVLYPNGFYVIGYFVVAPLLLALVYLYIIPEISQGVFKHYAEQQHLLAQLKLDAENEKPVSKEKWMKTLAEIRMMESKHQIEIDELSDRHKSNDDALTNALKESEQINSKFTEATLDLNKERTRVSELLEKVDDYEKKSVDDQIEVDRLTAELKNHASFGYDGPQDMEERQQEERQQERQQEVEQEELDPPMWTQTTEENDEASSVSPELDDDLSGNLREIETSIIGDLASTIESVPIEELQNTNDISKTKLEVFLDDLEKKDYVKVKKSPYGDIEVELTMKGKRYAVDKGLAK